MNASKIFDEALGKAFESKKNSFLQMTSGIFSNETQESLDLKIEIVKNRMSEGRRFSEICDDQDVFLGSVDREYVSWKIDHGDSVTGEGFGFGPMTLERFRSNYLYGLAMREIRR